MDSIINGLLNSSADYCAKMLSANDSLLHVRQKAAEYMIPETGEIVQIQIIVTRDVLGYLADNEISEERGID